MPSESMGGAGTHLKNRLWVVNGGLTEEKIQATIDLLVDLEKLPQGLSVTDVADLSYLSEVLADMGRL